MPRPRNAHPLRAPAAVVAALLLAGAPAAHAGGDAWPMRVLSLERGFGSAFTLVLEPVGDPPQPAEGLFACRRLQVSGRFTQPGWRHRHPPEVTRARHGAALELLARAQREARPLPFGVMGRGLVPAPDGAPCHARSRALWLQGDPLAPSGGAVLSLHDAI